jgi:hypothetical protein
MSSPFDVDGQPNKNKGANDEDEYNKLGDFESIRRYKCSKYKEHKLTIPYITYPVSIYNKSIFTCQGENYRCKKSDKKVLEMSRQSSYSYIVKRQITYYLTGNTAIILQT